MTTTEEQRLDELTEVQDDEVLTAEQAAALAATLVLRRELEQLFGAAVAALEAAALGAGPTGVRLMFLAQLRRRLIEIRVDVSGPLRVHFERALSLGVRQAFAQLGIRGRRFTVEMPTEVADLLRDIDQRVRTDVAAGAALLDAGAEVEDVEAAFARARRGITRTEQAATWGVNRSVATGVETVATEQQTDLLWIGERDACLHCLAYFGQIREVGGTFPSGLTFGDRPLSTGPVPNPPLHPNCRCRVTVWRGEWASGGGRDFPSSLAREARRSVARGWSLASESQAARVRAADRLLRAGAGLPKSVEEYAANAVRRGAFPRGRTFPG